MLWIGRIALGLRKFPSGLRILVLEIQLLSPSSGFGMVWERYFRKAAPHIGLDLFWELHWLYRIGLGMNNSVDWIVDSSR